MNNASQVRFDVLTWKPLRSLILCSWFPVLLQGVALAAVVWLAANGFGVGAEMEADDLKTLRKTNLTTLVVWGLWWPGMIAVALALGRVWCTVCPMELVNRMGDALARRIGWPRARLGAFLRAGWMTLVVYLVLQLLVAGISIHRVPHFTAMLLLTLIGLAIVSGLVFREGRSFCKAFCPASALLSVYGRFTPVQLEARRPSTCDSCATKDCLCAENRDRFDKRSCPSLLVPYRRAPSDGCVVCFQCVKVCPHENMGFGLVSEGSPIRGRSLLRPFEAVFVMIALGFVAHEVIGELKWLDASFHVVPSRLQMLAPTIPFGWFEALWFLVLFPMLVWALVVVAAYLAGYRDGLRSLLLGAATGAAPIVAVAHLAKAAAKIGSWGGFLPLALRDPRGVATFSRLADQSLAPPMVLLGLNMVGWISLAVIAILLWRGWRWSSALPEGTVVSARTGLFTAAMLFSAVLMTWTWTTG